MYNGTHFFASCMKIMLLPARTRDEKVVRLSNAWIVTKRAVVRFISTVD